MWFMVIFLTKRDKEECLFCISKCGKNLSQISLRAGSKGDGFQKIIFCRKIRIFFRITSEFQKATVWYRKKVIYREESLWNSEQCTVRNGGPYGGPQEVYSLWLRQSLTLDLLWIKAIKGMSFWYHRFDQKILYHRLTT